MKAQHIAVAVFVALAACTNASTIPTPSGPTHLGATANGAKQATNATIELNAASAAASVQRAAQLMSQPNAMGAGDVASSSDSSGGGTAGDAPRFNAAQLPGAPRPCVMCR